MWSIYFENVIDIAEVLNAKNNLKIVDSAIFKTFFSLDVFFRGSFFTFMSVGVFYNDADDFLSKTAKYNASLGGKSQKTSKLANLSQILTVFGLENPIKAPTHAW